MWITPKLDWTRTNYYNFEDLNRVENNTEIVAGLVGYFIGLPPLAFLTDRSMKRIEFADSLNRIEGNQDVLRQRFTPYGWMHRLGGSDARRVPQKVEGVAGDVRLDRVDLWENRNLYTGSNKSKSHFNPNNSTQSPREVIFKEDGYIIHRLSVNDNASRGINYYSPYIKDLGNLVVDEEYTMSCEVRSNHSDLSIRISTSDDWTPVRKNEWTVVKTTTSNIEDRFGMYSLQTVNQVNPMVLDVRKMKIEIGSAATPWQPAPEDNIPWYEPTKTVNLAPINLSSLDQYESSAIEWDADTPDGTRVDVEYSFDEVSWTAIQSGQSLPFRKGDWLTGKVLYLRQRLYTDDQSKTPTIRNFRYQINGYQTKVEWKANDPFDFNDALRLEHNLNLLYKHYKGNAEAVPVCGAFICGEEVI